MGRFHLTLQAWRIAHARRAADAHRGEGARIWGGRWNAAGLPVVYAAESLSLAALEILVHLPAVGCLTEFVSIALRFDAALCRRLEPTDLPDDWRADPVPQSTVEIGTRWCRSQASVVLAVPSAIVPLETNYLINPEQTDFANIELGAPEPFRFDPRLFAGS